MPAVNITGAAHLSEQYGTESRLDTRRSVWRDSLDGRNPADQAALAIREASPGAVLEVGCGGGQFAKRIAAENPDAVVTATDQSPRLVELAAGLGVNARVADVQDLPFADDAFDVVAAMWMLYHVPDLDRALAEVRRVLRPGGLFVAVTNGDEHTADLRREAGDGPLVTGFSSENGRDSLARHFDDIEAEHIATRAVFEDHAAAVAYLESSEAGLGQGLPFFEGPRTYAGATTVFCAR